MPDFLYTSPRTNRSYRLVPDDPNYSPTDLEKQEYAAYIEQQETASEQPTPQPAPTQPTAEAPDSGQSIGGARLNSAIQGITTIPGVVAQGVGATFLSPFGITSLEESGKYAAEKARELTPIDPKYRGNLSVDLFGAGGQALGQLASLYASGGGTIGTNVALAQAAAMGAASGAESAERRGLTGINKYNEVLGYGATEVLTERMFGFGSKSFFKPAVGLQGKAVKAGTTIGGEMVEEGFAGLGTNIVSNLTAVGLDIPSPELFSAESIISYGRQSLAGGVGGVVFAGAQLAMGEQATQESITRKSAVIDGVFTNVTGVPDEVLIQRGAEDIKLHTFTSPIDAEAIDSAPDGAKVILESIYGNELEVPIGKPTLEQEQAFDEIIAADAAKKAAAAAAGAPPPAPTDVTPPADATVLPTEETAPAEAAVLPTEETLPPADATVLPTEENIQAAADGTTSAEVVSPPTQTPPLPSGIRAGVQMGVASVDPDMRDLFAGILEYTLAKKGTLTWKDIPKELSDAYDTLSFGALKSALSTNPQEAISLIRGDQNKTSTQPLPSGATPTETGTLPKTSMTGVSGGVAPAPVAAAPIGIEAFTSGPLAKKVAKKNVAPKGLTFGNKAKGIPPRAVETPEGNVEFVTPEMAPGIPQPARRTPLNDTVVKETVRKVFGTIPANLSFINIDKQVDGMASAKAQTIDVNLRYIPNAKRLEEVLRHEATHLIYQDPLVQADIELLKQEIPADLAAEVDRLYSDPEFTDSIRKEEAVVRLVERLQGSPKSQNAWQRLVESVRVAFRKLFGRSPTPRELNQAANRILERAVANVAVQRTDAQPDGMGDASDVRLTFAGEQSIQNFSGELGKVMADSLDAAKAMAAAGKSRKEIRAVTGWFPGFGKGNEKLRYEVPDTDSEFTKKGFGRSGGLDSVLIHPDLYKVYPDAQDINLLWDPNLDGRGSFRKNSNTITINPNGSNQLRTLLHELQHWIQAKEGFAIGGNLDVAAENIAVSGEVYKQAVQAAEKAEKEYARLKEAAVLRLRAEKGSDKPFILDQELADLEPEVSSARSKAIKARVEADFVVKNNEALKVSNRDAYSEYQRIAGEIEARDIANRLDLSDEQRKATAPYSSENIAEEDAIVMFGSSGPQMSISPKSPEAIRHGELEAKFNAGRITAEETAEAQRIVDEAAKAAGGKAVFRYVSRDGMGMLNSKAYNIDKLNDDDASDLEEWLNYGLEQPRDVAQDQVFYFTEDGKLTNEEGLRLLKKAARRGFFEEVRFVFGEPSWATNDGQIAVNPNQIKSAEPFTGIPLDERFDARKDDIRYSVTPESQRIDQEYLAAVEAGDMETAQRIVDEAAKKNEDSIRATEANLKAEFYKAANEIGSDSPEAEASYERYMPWRQKLRSAEEDTLHPNQSRISIAPIIEAFQNKHSDSFSDARARWDKRGEKVRDNENLGGIFKATGSGVLFRGVSLEDYNRIKKEGFIDTDFRAAITKQEGINLTPDTRTASYYTPMGGNGVILAINTDGLDLYNIGADSYIRSFDKIPAERIIDVTEPFYKSQEGSYYTQDNGPVSYDKSGNIIPPSKRFQKTSDDIRYSMTPVDDTDVLGYTTQVFGEKMSVAEVESIKEIYESVRKNLFDYTQAVTDASIQEFYLLLNSMRPTESGKADILWLKDFGTETAYPGAVLGALFAFSDKIPDGGQAQREIIELIERSRIFPKQSFSDFWTSDSSTGTATEGGRALGARSYIVNYLNKLRGVLSHRALRIEAAAKKTNLPAAEIKAIDTVSNGQADEGKVAEGLDGVKTPGGTPVVDAIAGTARPEGENDPRNKPENSPTTDPKTASERAAKRLIDKYNTEKTKKIEKKQADVVTVLFKEYLSLKGAQSSADLKQKLIDAGLSPATAAELTATAENELNRLLQAERDRDSKPMDGADALSPSDKSATAIVSKLAVSQSDTWSWPNPANKDPVVALVARYYKGNMPVEQLNLELEKLKVEEGLRAVLINAVSAELSKKQSVAKAKEADVEKDALAIINKLSQTQSDTLSWPIEKPTKPIVELVTRFYDANGSMSAQALDAELIKLGLPTRSRIILVNSVSAELSKRQAVKAAREKLIAENKPTKSAESFAANWQKSQDASKDPKDTEQDPVRSILNQMSKVGRGEFHFDLSPDGKGLFFEIVYKKLLSLNVSEKAAMAATSAAYQKYLTNRANQIAALRKAVAEKGLSKALAREMMSITATNQRDPEFAKKFIKQVLLDAGIPEDIADASLPLLLPSFQKALADTREQLLRDFIDGRPKGAKRIPKPVVDEFLKAVRLGATNPDYEPSTPFAKANKWRNFTRAEHDEMARLDEIAMDPMQTRQEQQIALAGIAKIISSKVTEYDRLVVAAEIYRNSALSNLLTTGGIQVWTPVFSAAARVLTDGVVGLAKERNFNRFIASVESFMRAASPTALKSELFSAFGQNITTFNKAYELDNQAQLNQLSNLYTILQNSIKTWKTTKNPVAKAKALIGITYGSMDYVRRAYASLDNVSQSVFYRQIMDLGVRDIILKANGTEADFRNMISNRTRRHEQIVTELISQGQSPSRAWVNASEISRREMAGEIVDIYGSDVGAQVEAQDVISRKETAREIGVASDAELDGHVIPMLIETIKALSKAADNRMAGSGALTSLILFGFPVTALKVMNRSLDYSIVGLFRAINSAAETKKYANDPEYKSKYPSYKTDNQRHQRMAETAVGTIGMFILLAMVMGERDKEPEDRLFMVHNAGPRDRAARQIWRAAGNEPQSVQFRFGTNSPWLGVSWAKAGLEVFAPIFAVAGATFDSTDPTIRREDAYDQVMVFASQSLASMSRPLSSIQDTAGVLSGKEMSLSSRSLANQIGFRASSFLPWSSLARNYNKWQGARDTTNALSAFAAMIPIVGPSLTEPALNSLGDPIGKTPNEYSFKLGTAIPVSVGFRREDTPLYEFLLSKGKFPTAISRPTQEKKYGKMSDETWRKYIEVRGQNLKSLILKRKDSLQKLDAERYDDAIENLTGIANDRARNQLKLRPAK